MSEPRNQFTFYKSYYDAISLLPEGDQAAVIMAVAAYALYEIEPDLEGVPASVFTLIRPTLDAGRRKAESGRTGGKISKRKAKDKQTVSKPEAKDKQTVREKEKEVEIEKELEIDILKEKDIKKKSSTPSRFTPPTVDEIRAYCAERGNDVDPDRFYDFYASKGWRVGQNPMRDWRAAVRTWERRDERPGGAIPFPQQRTPDYRNDNPFLQMLREEGEM